MVLIRIIAARIPAARTVTTHFLTEPLLAYALDFSELTSGEETTRIKVVIGLSGVYLARAAAAAALSRPPPVYKKSAFG